LGTYSQIRSIRSRTWGRLITCGGSFDATARSYRDNIVVYASEVSTTPLAPAG